MSAVTPLRLDTAACDRCGACVPRCAAKALRVGPSYIQVDWEKCTACGNCAEVCEPGAIRLRGATVAVAASAPPRNVVPIGSARDKKAVKPAGRAAAPKKPPVPHPSLSVGVSWTPSDAFLVVVVMFALLVAAGALSGLLAEGASRASITHVVNSAALAGLAWFLAHRHGARLMTALLLDVAPELRNVLLAVAVALACRVFSMTYAAVVPPASAPGPDLLTQMFGGGAVGIAATFFVVAIVAPVLEEALLRGVVLGAMAPWIGTWWAILASSAVFAALHLDVWSLLPFAVLGVGLGWLATRSRSLWPAVLAHVLYNAAILAATFLYAAAR